MLSALVELSNRYGADPDMVLAGGGNTSYKDAEFLYVKASGTTLADVKADGFVKMNQERLNGMMEKRYPEETAEREAAVLVDMMAARAAGYEHMRPSVEAPLHNLFPQAFVVHTHPAMVNGLTCGRDGREAAARLFGDKAVWIDLTQPGYILSVTVKRAMDDHRVRTGVDAGIVFLQNHGIFVAGNTPGEIDERYAYVMDTLKAEIRERPDGADAPFDRERAALLAPAVRMLLRPEGGRPGVVRFDVSADIARFVESEAAFYPVSSAYTPDHIVYYKRAPLFVAAADDPDAQRELLRRGLESYRNAYGGNPQVVAVQGLGVFCTGATKKQADTARLLFRDAAKIAVYSRSFGGPLFMTEDMIAFICNWEVESYRQKVAAAGAAPRRAEGRIAIVTGSAQGFGLGLAEQLLEQGAYVVMADMNAALAAENAAAFNDRFGAGRALAVAVNVGDEDSVREMIYATAMAYGGLDVFVNNAGVVRSGSLEEMDVPNFEFVTKINYTAYFLCVKYASRLMKIQHACAPEYMMDIVQINSKSGLAGSNKNFAYAGGKFGGVGLTQSFAMELVEYGIKVNAICPGNLMSGPLWLDPEKGLFVQYLRTGKVPGAKTVEDVKRFYEAKVPMNRGCEIVDVARALFYVMEQEYETGQAIPVTGGQIMLK